MFKCRITAKSLGKLTPDQLLTRIALEQGGAQANAAIEARVCGPNTDATGTRLAPKHVKTSGVRGLWNPRKASKSSKAQPGKAGPIPPAVFQRLRLWGGIFKAVETYKSDGLQGGTAVAIERAPVTWHGKVWEVGDVAGYWWPDQDAFLRDQGKGDRVTLGGRGSRIWNAAYARAAVRANGHAFLTLGFSGTKPKGSAVQALDQRGQKTKTGRAKKVSAANIVGVLNTRSADGTVGKPSQTGGQPHGGVAPLAEHGKPVQRWHALSREELGRTVLPAIATGVRDAIRKAPMSVVLVEKGQRRKVK